jgi:hypothetical protein
MGREGFDAFRDRFLVRGQPCVSLTYHAGSETGNPCTYGPSFEFVGVNVPCGCPYPYGIFLNVNMFDSIKKGFSHA